MNNHCNNCGRSCHCGAALYETVQNYDEPEFEIKICDHCRCDTAKGENNE